MERIKQAIQRVKSQQAIGAGQFDNSGISSAAAIQQPADALKDLSYNQTRVVKLQASHLEKNRIFAFNKNDPTSVTFDVLRTQILQIMEEKGLLDRALQRPPTNERK